MPTVTWKGSSSYMTAGVNTTLVEQPNSPTYVFGEKTKCTRRFKGLHSLCLSSAPAKGALGSGAMTGYYVVQSTVTREPKQVGELVIEYEAYASSSGATLPPDEFSLKPFETNPKLERNPFFATLTKDDLDQVRDCIENADPALRLDVYNTLALSVPLAADLVDKLLAGQETYYLAGWTYSWSSYSWTIPTVSDGGTIETPGGPMTGLLGTGIDWLRQADDLDFDGSKYKLTKTWLGGPDGHWDTDLY